MPKPRRWKVRLISEREQLPREKRVVASHSPGCAPLHHGAVSSRFARVPLTSSPSSAALIKALEAPGSRSESRKSLKLACLRINRRGTRRGIGADDLACAILVTAAFDCRYGPSGTKLHSCGEIALALKEFPSDAG
jgi:hypothetical protein